MAYWGQDTSQLEQEALRRAFGQFQESPAQQARMNQRRLQNVTTQNMGAPVNAMPGGQRALGTVADDTTSALDRYGFGAANRPASASVSTYAPRGPQNILPSPTTMLARGDDPWANIPGGQPSVIAGDPYRSMQWEYANAGNDTLPPSPYFNFTPTTPSVGDTFMRASANPNPDLQTRPPGQAGTMNVPDPNFITDPNAPEPSIGDATSGAGQLDPEAFQRAMEAYQRGDYSRLSGAGGAGATTSNATAGAGAGAGQGTDTSAPTVTGGGGTGTGGGTGARRVPLRGTENPDNLYGVVNPDVLGNENANELNRRFRRIASRYPPTAAGVEQLMQDPDWLADPDLSQATYDGRGNFDFHGAPSQADGTGTPVGLVDTMNAFDGTNSRGWGWIDQAYVNEGGGGGTSGGGRDQRGPSVNQSQFDLSMLPQGAGSLIDAMGFQPDLSSDDSVLQQVLAELQALTRGQQSTLTQNTLQGAFGRK